VTGATITASVCFAMNGDGEAGPNQPRSQGGAKLDGMNLGMRVLSYLISGVALYGFLGWLGDHFLGTHFLLPIGIVAGAALGCYAIIRRFGSIDEAAAEAGDSTMTDKQAGGTKEGAK
jgi:ATP synthase protein I